MELKLYEDDLRFESMNYSNHFELRISDFLPTVQQVIRLTHASGGRTIYYEFGNPGAYSAITE